MNTFIKFFVAFVISLLSYPTPPLIAMDDDPLESAHRLITQDPERAHHLFENTDEDSERAFSVALYLEQSQKPEEALKWYLKIGDSDSLIKAAELFLKGVDGRPNRGQAIRCYEDAAQKGSSWAKKQMSIILTQWENDNQDTLVLFLARNPTLVPEITDGRTLLKTGERLESGVNEDGISQNLMGAFSCYARASQLNCAKAAIRAAAFLESGFGSQAPDLERAAQFLSLARRLGS